MLSLLSKWSASEDGIVSQSKYRFSRNNGSLLHLGSSSMAKMMLTSHSSERGTGAAFRGDINLKVGDLRDMYNSQPVSSSRNECVTKGSFWEKMFTPSLCKKFFPSPQILACQQSSVYSTSAFIGETSLAGDSSSQEFLRAENYTCSLRDQKYSLCMTLSGGQCGSLPHRKTSHKMGSDGQKFSLMNIWMDTLRSSGFQPFDSVWFSCCGGCEFSCQCKDSSSSTPSEGHVCHEPTACDHHAASHVPSSVKFKDEEDVPVQPVNSWEELEENSHAGKSSAIDVNTSDDSLVTTESPKPATETETMDECATHCDLPTQMQRLDLDDDGGDGCRDLKMKSQQKDASSRCLKKGDSSDLTYVLFDRSGKTCSRNRKRRQRWKQNLHKCDSKPEAKLQCVSLSLHTSAARPDPTSVPQKTARPPKTASKKLFCDDPFGRDIFDLCLGSGRLADFLPGCQSPAKTTCCIAAPPDEESSALHDLNVAWGINVNRPSQVPPKQKSRVHFAEGKMLTTVHKQVAWSFAYQAARHGPWEQCARDRNRFRKRIEDMEGKLAKVLSTRHRDMVWAKYFD